MSRARVVIVGAGFAGYHAARTLARLARGAADIIVINPTDYFLYLPLLPEVAGGLVDPRRVMVPLASTLPGVRIKLADADGVDVAGRTVSYTDAEGGRGTQEYDHLIIAAGSVHKLLPIPGIAEHAHGFRGIPEALYLRDHLLQQIELAASTDDPEERAARCTFVVAGAGYTGTEVAAHGQLLSREAIRDHRVLEGVQPRWLLLDVADRVLPGLSQRLSASADRVLRGRGVEVCMETSVDEATATGVRLTDGRFVPTRTLVWCVGVRPDPFGESTGLPLRDGRLVVDEYLTVPSHPEIMACGDAAAVPDVTRPGELTPMTAQHAVRQGRLAARNLAAAYGRGRRKQYKHRDLGFAVDLGGWQAAANPLHRTVSGPVARTITRAYHLASLPTNRMRIATEWLFDAVGSRPTVRLGVVPGSAVPLDTAAPEEGRAN